MFKKWFFGKKCFFCETKLGKEYSEIKFSVQDEKRMQVREICLECSEDFEKMKEASDGSI